VPLLHDKCVLPPKNSFSNTVNIKSLIIRDHKQLVGIRVNEGGFNMSLNPRMTLIGGITGLVGMITAFIGIIGGAFLYGGSSFRPFFIREPFPIFLPWPNTGISIVVQHVSELGIGPTSFMFNTGLIIAGILAIPLLICLIKPLGNTWVAKIGVASGIVAFIGLIGLAVYTEYTNYAIHILFSNVFFIFIAISIVLITYAMRSTSFFTWVHIWLGIIFVVADLIFFALMFIAGFSAIMEWTVVLIILVWAFAISVQMLLKREETTI